MININFKLRKPPIPLEFKEKAFLLLKEGKTRREVKKYVEEEYGISMSEPTIRRIAGADNLEDLKQKKKEGDLYLLIQLLKVM